MHTNESSDSENDSDIFFTLNLFPKGLKQLILATDLNIGTKLIIIFFVVRLEYNLVTGATVPGSILATPSAPSVPTAPSAPSCVEDDSDCDSWGSDFDDDDDTTENPRWAAQEEVENDINIMLEAAMERSRNLENSVSASHGTAQQLFVTSDANISPEWADGLLRPADAPPLPPRNPGPASSASAGNRNQDHGSPAANATTSRDLSASANVSHINSPRQKQTARDVISPSPGTVATPLSSILGAFPGARETPIVTTTTEPYTKWAFPPDLVSSVGSSPSSLRWPSATAEVADPASSFQSEEVSSTPPQRNIPTSGSHESTEIAVPPPLPSRPPPVTRLQANKTKLRNVPIRTVGAASAQETKYDDKSKDISQQSSAGPSTSQTNLPKMTPQKSTVPKSVKPISNKVPGPSSGRPDNSGLQEKPPVKSKPRAFSVPKILREMDAAVLNQVLPKTPKKTGRISESQQSLAESRRPCEDKEKTEDVADNPTDEYLNPKEATAAGTTKFIPDRPTLPRRLRQSRSLPLINLKKDLYKNKVTTEGKVQQKLNLQSSQAISETSVNGAQFPAEIDEVSRQPWYHPVTWAQAQFKLTAMGQDSAFLVRPSSRVSQGVPYTVSVFYKGRIINCHISYTPDKKYVLGKLKPNQKTFDNITELIQYYQSTPAELKVSEAEPIAKVCLLITPPKDNDEIYAV